MVPFADNVMSVIESDVVHTTDHPFCLDPTCPCKEDQELIQAVAEQVQNGLLTPDEASRFIAGKTL